jgi:hypothetical protein
MHSLTLIPRPSRILRQRLGLLLGLVLLGTMACAHSTAMSHEKPAASAFGLGPKSSEHGFYTAVLQPAETLRARRLQKICVLLRDPAGRPVNGATIKVDGGMPEHGHGLPTQPRVAACSVEGVYVVEGLRFNMGGWWEVAFAIDGPRGADRVVFHLQI